VNPGCTRRRTFAALAGGACGLVWPTVGRAAVDPELLRQLRAGATLLMRHTLTTPGVGDPPGWRLDQCASQRNLAPEGIAHARRIGQWFAGQQLRVAEVRNTPWCRTRDTAQLAFGRRSDWPALANIFEDRTLADAQAAEARRAVAGAAPGELRVWVSHGVTIAHIVGSAAGGLAPGEAVVVRGGAPLQVLGRLTIP